jgi:hypothetical protein
MPTALRRRRRPTELEEKNSVSFVCIQLPSMLAFATITPSSAATAEKLGWSSGFCAQQRSISARYAFMLRKESHQAVGLWAGWPTACHREYCHNLPLSSPSPRYIPGQQLLHRHSKGKNVRGRGELDLKSSACLCAYVPSTPSLPHCRLNGCNELRRERPILWFRRPTGLHKI